MSEYKVVAITCKAKDMLDEIAKLNPTLKKGALMSELIEEYYNNKVGQQWSSTNHIMQ